MRFILPIGFILALIGAYGWLWTTTAERLEGALQTWIDGQRSAGLEATYDRVRIGGFPYRLSMTIERPHLSGGDETRSWRWQGDGIRVHALPLQSNHVIIEAIGEHTLTLERADRERTRVTHVIVTAEAARSSLVETAAGLGRLAIDIQALSGQRSTRIVDPDGKSTSSPAARNTFKISRIQLHSAPDTETTPGDTKDGAIRRISLRAEGGESGLPLVPGLSTTFERAEGRLTITGIPREAANTHGWLATETLQAWRGNGGRVDVADVTIDWAPVSTHVAGSVTLDRRGRPQGTLDIRLERPGAVLTGLSGNGFVDHSFAALTHAVLALQSNPDADHQEGEDLTLPLSMKNGTLSLAGIRIGSAPSLFADAPDAAPE